MKACEDYFDLISARLDDALSAEDAAALDAHLAICPECRRLAADLANLHAAFPGLNAVPPADLLPNVMARIRAEDRKVLPFAPPAKHKIRWRALSGMAAMLTLVLLGAAIFRFGSPTAPEGTPAPLLAVNDAQKTAPPVAPRSLPTETPAAAPVPTETPAPATVPQPTVAPQPTAAPEPRLAPEVVAAPRPPVAGTAPGPANTAQEAPSAPAPTVAPAPVEDTRPHVFVSAQANPAAELIPAAAARLFALEALAPYEASTPLTVSDDFTGYVLAADCRLEYSGPSENGAYLLFSLSAPAAQVRYAVPKDSAAPILTEQDDPAAFLAGISN